MITVGVDLSADPEKTGLARVRWTGGRAVVEQLELGWQVSDLADAIEPAGWAAIDAPFGWPDRFIETIESWARLRRWPAIDRERLRFRLTDERVRKTKIPLSVSSDRIASTAMRCAELLEELSQRSRWSRPLDRAGADQVVECYPAAALTKWGLQIKGYKGDKAANKQARKTLVAELAPPRGWLKMDSSQRTACVERDHCLDAVACALIARAAACGLLDEPLPEGDELDQASREGWIYLPAAGSLPALVQEPRGVAAGSGS